jgi:PEGA domain/Tetratricopeptide repeat
MKSPLGHKDTKVTKNRFLYFCVSLCLSVFLLKIAFSQETPPPESKPEEAPIEEEAMQMQWTKAFQEAETTFNSANQTSSIPMFESLTTQITEQKVKRGLTDPEMLLLLRSLDYLGQANYNEGETEKAKLVFLKLMELNPNYQLNQDLTSPKIIEFVKKIKDQNLGTITITTEPPGATLKLDGVAAGTTDITGLYSLKGDHDLEISKPGFVSQQSTINVVPGKSQKFNFKLERSSSVAYFITYPKGVEISMGEKLLGTTGGTTPPQRAEQSAIAMNVPLADFSDEFAVPDLQPGSYEVQFKKPCWETQLRRITIEENADYPFEPIVLSPSIAQLNITADDEKANVFIDNEYIGLAPLQKHQLCAGKHLIKIKGPRGKYESTIDVKKNQALNIDARLNPSLTFMGLVAAPDILKSDLDKLTVEINQNLSKLQNLNYEDNSQTGDRMVVQETLRKILEGIKANTPDKDRRSVIQELCSSAESDLLLIGYVPKEKLQRTVEFYLLSNWSSMADIRTLQVFDSSEWKRFMAQLDYEEPLFQKRLGVYLIDTLITEGPVIAQVLLKGNGDNPLLNGGDQILAIAGKPVKNAAEVQRTLLDLQKSEAVKISLQRGGTPMDVDQKLLNSPMEIQFNNPTLLFNRQLIGFKKAYNLSVNPLEKNIAMLNIGLCHMHFAEYDLAFEQLRQVQLDRAVGIGPGTVQYRIAQCYRELGYKKESGESLQEAAKYSQNTIYSDDGPSLQREIRRAQLALQ